MKNIFYNFFISLVVLCLVKGQSITIPTNYTLGYFKSYNM